MQSVEPDFYEEPHFKALSNEEILFNTECMQNLETFAEDTNANQVSAMTIHPEQSSPMADNIPLSPEVDPDFNECYEANTKALKQIEAPVSNLIKKFPKILKPNFRKEPTPDIYHRIETTGQPFKSKVRPLLATSESQKKAKRCGKRWRNWEL